MPILERIGRLAARPEQLLERRREQIAELRRAVGPLIGDLLLVMAEIRRGRARSVPSGFKPHDLAHGVHGGRLAVGSKPHHLVLVAVVRKAEILRQRLIEDAERMRKIDAAVDRDLRAAARRPRRRSRNRRSRRPRRPPPPRTAKRERPRRDARGDARSDAPRREKFSRGKLAANRARRCR